MADKRYRPGEVRAVEVRIIPNRGDVHLEDLIVVNPQYRILRYKNSGELEELYTWANGSYDSDKGIVVGIWDGTLAKIQIPDHYAMELRATIDTEVPKKLVSIDVEL